MRPAIRGLAIRRTRSFGEHTNGSPGGDRALEHARERVESGESSVRASLTTALLCLTAILWAHGRAPFATAETTGPAGAADVDAAFSHADSLRAEGRLDSALVVLGALRDERHRAGAAGDEARAAFRIGRVLRFMNRPAEAESALAEAASLSAQVADTLLWCRSLFRQAQAADAQGRPPRAIAMYERVIELAERAGLDEFVGRGDLYLGRREIGAGQLESAARRLERAIALFQRLDLALDENGAKLFLGICQHRAGDVDAARRSWTDALRYAREHDQASLEGNCLTNLGLLEANAGRPDRAAVHWDEAYAVLRAQNRLRAAIAPASNAALAFRELGRYEDAERLLNEQLAIAREFGFRDHEASARIALGEIARDRLRSGEAVGHYRAALHLLQETDLPALEADALKGLARTLDDADSLAAAVTLMEEHLPQIVPRLGREKRVVIEGELAQLLLHAGRYAEVLPLARAIAAEADDEPLPVKVDLHIRRIAAAAHRGLGYPDSAYVYLRQAADSWEAMRSRPDDPMWREQRAELGSAIHGALADLLLEHPAQLPVAARRERAFAFLQRFRSRALIERMLGEDAGARAPTDALTLSAIQTRVLVPGELLLDIHAASDQTLVFAVTTDSCRVVRVGMTETRLARNVGICRGLLAAPPSSASGDADLELLARTTATLASALLAGVSDLIAAASGIVYVPDGALHRIPLRPLLAGDVDATVLRVPSCAVLALLRDVAPSTAAGAPSTLAYAAAGPSVGGDLAGARGEVRQLAGRYRHVHLWRDDEAGSLRGADLVGYDVVHLAGHITVDDERPWRSGIALGAGGSGSADSADVSGPGGAGSAEADSMLRAEAIVSLDLDARLAVLSGCESAGGRIVSGEGMLGLGTAFLVAGTRCVVSTLWPVDDAQTARFMDVFYRALERGRSVAGALGTAQRRMREDPETTHPFYWAGFTVMGDGRATIALERRHSWPGRALIGLGIGLGVTAVWWRRRAGSIDRSTRPAPRSV